jgi:hypothetical protein
LYLTEFQQPKEGIFPLDNDAKRFVRAEVSSILRRAIIPPKNIDSNVFKALLALQKDPDRVILSADKANFLLLWTNMIIARRLLHC